MIDDDPIAPAELVDAIAHVRAICAADPSRYAQWFADYLGAYMAGEALDPAEYLTAIDNEQGQSVRRRARRDRRNRLLCEEAAALFPGGGDFHEQARLLERAMIRPRSPRLREAVELGGPIKAKAIWRVLYQGR